MSAKSCGHISLARRVQPSVFIGLCFLIADYDWLSSCRRVGNLYFLNPIFRVCVCVSWFVWGWSCCIAWPGLDLELVLPPDNMLSLAYHDTCFLKYTSENTGRCWSRTIIKWHPCYYLELLLKGSQGLEKAKFSKLPQEFTLPIHTQPRPRLAYKEN